MASPAGMPVRRALLAGALLALLSLLAACTGEPVPTATPPPTQPLNTAYPTATAVEIRPTATFTSPPSAGDTATPRPDATELARTVQRQLALTTVSAAAGIPASEFEVIALTGVRAGREIGTCGRAQSGMMLASALRGETVTEVLIDGDTATVCGTANLYDERPELFLARDPVAADLVDLALQRAARAAQVDAASIAVDSARPVEWADATLDCAAGAATPDPATVKGVSGYRIVLTAAGKRYIYHTDFDRILPCATE